MTITYQVKLIQKDNYQTIILPKELNFVADEITIKQEDNKLIIEPLKKKSLLEVFGNLDDIEEDFPDVDQDLLPLIKNTIILMFLVK